jgi:hypothetical protein
MDPDMSLYDATHAVTAHPLMTKEQWTQAYNDAWSTYYSDAHVETLIRRAIATGCSPGKVMFLSFWFRGCAAIERLHPLECGVMRLRSRSERRQGLPIEPAWLFYPREWIAGTAKAVQWLSLYIHLRMIYRRVRHDPRKLEYMDAALEPVVDEPHESTVREAAG